MNIPSSITTLVIGVLLTLISLWFGQHHGLLPVEASEEAPLIDGLFNLMMTIGIGLFIIVQGTLVYAGFKFRRQPDDDTDGPPIEGNIPLEILWTAIPAVIVLGLAVYSFDVYSTIGGLDPMGHGMAHKVPSHQTAALPGAAIAAPLPETPEAIASQTVAQAEALDSPASTPSMNMGDEMVIQAQGLQYAWIFTYPDSGVVSGELHVPVGRPIKLEISAADVLHAFWVPEFRLKQDAIPGTPTELRFTPKKMGDYPVICAELCGPYHGAMKTRVIAESPEDFTAWIDSQTVATNTVPDQAIALSAAEKSPEQFLAPYVSDLGVTAEALHTIQPPHLHAH